MATGIQTGMRTGSRSGLATGRSAIGKGGGGGGPLGKFKEIWGGLSKGVRIFICVLLGLVLTGVLTFTLVQSANQYVPLYTTKMTQEDVKEVAMKLTDLGIEHEINETTDGILIHPRVKAKAQIQLAAHGLPRHPITTPYNMGEGGLSAKTQAEQKAINQRLMEGELTESIRQIDGVADAYVNLAQPEQTYFRDDSKPVTATVLLKMQPAAELSREQIQGIVHLVAYSVPELAAENVKVVDTQGLDLTATLPQGPNGEAASGSQGEIKSGLEREMSAKVQKQLDAILGAGKAVAEVNCELDFSHNEVTRKTVGGPADQGSVVVGKQVKRETFRRDPGAPSEGGQQMALDQASVSSAAKKDANYDQVVESYKVEANEVVSRTVDKSYRIKRLTASVAVDNLKPDQVDKIAGIVKNAIGIDETRGDSVEVASLPFARNTVSGLGGGVMAFPETTPATTPGGITFRHVTAVVSLGALGLLGLIMLFLVKQHKVHVGQGKLVLGSNHSGTTSSDIADLLNEKSGKSNAPASAAGETKVNTTDQLEKLAKERPTKVAEMLKSTWLSQGG